MSAAAPALGFPLRARTIFSHPGRDRKSKSGWAGAIALSQRRVRGQSTATTWATKVLDTTLLYRGKAKTGMPRLSGLGLFLHARIQSDLVHRHVIEASYRIGQLVDLCGGSMSRDTVLRQADRLVLLGEGRLWIRGSKGRGLETEFIFRLAETSSFAVVAQDRYSRAQHARKATRRAKNPQNAFLLPPSESFLSEKPPTEATPTPLQSEGPVGVAPLKGDQDPQTILQETLQSHPDYIPEKAIRTIAGLRMPGKDLSLLASTVTELLTRLSKEAMNPMGLLFYRLQHHPSRVLADARKIASRIEGRIKDSNHRVDLHFQGPEAIRRDPAALEAYLAWQQVRAGKPLANSPGYLDHLDVERVSWTRFLDQAERFLPEGVKDEYRESLRGQLLSSGLTEDSPIWKRVWMHHWSIRVTQSLGLAEEL